MPKTDRKTDLCTRANYFYPTYGIRRKVPCTNPNKCFRRSYSFRFAPSRPSSGSRICRCCCRRWGGCHRTVLLPTYSKHRHDNISRERIVNLYGLVILIRIPIISGDISGSISSSDPYLDPYHLRVPVRIHIIFESISGSTPLEK